jgi:hypothetical protein
MPTPQTLDSDFSSTELESVIDQAMIYQCACPAQVARLMLALREVHRYEAGCLQRQDAYLAQTHRLIAEATEKAHAIMEQCLQEVMQIEGWQREGLIMPDTLREHQLTELDRWKDLRKPGAI